MAGTKSASLSRFEALILKNGEKRVKNRARKRIMVRFGANGEEKTAFTKNMSETGLFIRTNAVLKPGSTISIRMEFPEHEFTMWARVVWSKKVPPQLAHILDCGMGICFIDPTAEWLSFFREWSGTAK